MKVPLQTTEFRAGKTTFRNPGFHWISLPILALGIILLQYHSIQLWQGWTGWWSGLGWSVLLELISLWMWFLAGSWGEQRGWLRRLALYFLAGVTSTILLVGPLYQVSRPIIAEVNAAHASRQQIIELNAEIDQIRNGLAVYRQNSLVRLGWQRKIDEAEANLANARHRLRSLQLKDAGLPWLRWGPLLLQGLSLVLFQIANILAISHIAINVSTTGTETENAWKAAGNGNGREGHATGPRGSPDSLVRALQNTLKTRLETGGMSQAEFCRRHSLNPRDVSLLFHYFQNKSDGKRNVSMQFLESLQSRFLPTGGFEGLNAGGPI